MIDLKKIMISKYKLYFYLFINNEKREEKIKIDTFHHFFLPLDVFIVMFSI